MYCERKSISFERRARFKRGGKTKFHFPRKMKNVENLNSEKKKKKGGEELVKLAFALEDARRTRAEKKRKKETNNNAAFACLPPPSPSRSSFETVFYVDPSLPLAVFHPINIRKRLSASVSRSGEKAWLHNSYPRQREENPLPSLPSPTAHPSNRPSIRSLLARPVSSAYRALRGSMDPRHTARNIYGITWRCLNSKAAVCPTSYRGVCFLGGFSAPQGVPRSFFLPLSLRSPSPLQRYDAVPSSSSSSSCSYSSSSSSRSVSPFSFERNVF